MAAAQPPVCVHGAVTAKGHGEGISLMAKGFRSWRRGGTHTNNGIGLPGFLHLTLIEMHIISIACNSRATS